MKLKVTMYMKSGNKFSFKCTKFEISKLTESKCDSREAHWEGANIYLSVDLMEIEAVTFKKVLF